MLNRHDQIFVLGKIPTSNFVCAGLSNWSTGDTWGFGFDDGPWKNLLRLLNCRLINATELVDFFVILLGLQRCITGVSSNRNNYWRYVINEFIVIHLIAAMI